MIRPRSNPSLRPTTRRPPSRHRPTRPRRGSRPPSTPKGCPKGRALHLVDVENLAGGPLTGLAEDALAQYLAASEWREGDHVVVAGHPMSVLQAGLVIDVPCRLVAAHGPDGGDRALLAAASDPEFVMNHYDKVAIGSGDGIFAGLAETLHARGLEVWVVAPTGGLSMRLGAAGTRVVTLAHPNEASE
jgi:hypothetical protein